MNDELINKLSELKLEETCLKRNLDANYLKKDIRKKMFGRLKQNKDEQNKIKFKLRMERELKNENNNTDYPKK